MSVPESQPAPTEFASDAEMDAFAGRVGVVADDLDRMLKEVREGSGVEAASLTAGGAGVVGGIVALVVVWWLWGFWLGLLAGVVALFGLTGLLVSVSKKPIDTAIKLLTRRVQQHPEYQVSLFRAVVVERYGSSSDPDLGQRLRKRFAALGANNPEVRQLRSRIKALANYESRRARAAQQAKREAKEAQKEARRAQKEALREEEARRNREEMARKDAKKLKQIQAVVPGACLPVFGQNVKFHPSFAELFSVAGEFSVSDAFFVISTSGSYEEAMRIPMDCIQQVKIGDATKGMSVEANVHRLLKPLAGEGAAGIRIRVDFHLVVPIYSTNPAGWSGYSGVSFEITGYAWPEVEEAWTRFAQKVFLDAPRCPSCGKLSVMGKDVSIGAAFGLTQPTIRATCQDCGAKLVFQPTEGRFISP